MSVSEIQKKKTYSEIAKILYSSGEKPRQLDIYKLVSSYFSEHPAGVPLELNLDSFQKGLLSDVDSVNKVIAHTSFNLDIAYEAVLEHIINYIDSTTVFNTSLSRLERKRAVLMSRLDNYLLTTYNTDGYFYSVGDVFADIDSVDLDYTTCFIDVETGSVQLSPISNMTRVVRYDDMNVGSLDVKSDGAPRAYNTVYPIQGAIDGLSNTTWSLEVETASPKEITCEFIIDLPNQRDFPVSRVSFTPYGVEDMQVFVQVKDLATNKFVNFDDRIQSSTQKMIFVDRPYFTNAVKITLIKRTPDYVLERNGSNYLRYIIGAKDISMAEYIYDSEGIFVSKPLSLPTELFTDEVIDAVSLVADTTIPDNTEIDFYVAIDKSDAESISDFEWKPINPIGNGDGSSNEVVSFNGSTTVNRYIRADETNGALKLLELNDSDPDLRSRNPSSTILSTADAYRLAKFDDEFITSSIKLEEGINTTKIIYTELSDEAIDSLLFWRSIIEQQTYETVTYGRIDSGNGFFYGGDVGQSSKSIYVETYLEVMDDLEPLIRNFNKLDANSKRWDVRIYLNGIELAYLPKGVDTSTIAWNFRKGSNHICLLINIPESSDVYPNIYLGELALLDKDKLYDYGVAKLGNWQYVDLFNMDFNEVGQPQTFTVHDGEIISRRIPTDNFKLTYVRSASDTPSAIRLRADLSRTSEDDSVTPLLNSYRVRFAYGS